MIGRSNGLDLADPKGISRGLLSGHKIKCKRQRDEGRGTVDDEMARKKGIPLLAGILRIMRSYPSRRRKPGMRVESKQQRGGGILISLFAAASYPPSIQSV